MDNFVSKEMSDRLRNPVFGSIILSWITINWKYIVTIIYGTGTDKYSRFEYIDKVLYPGGFCDNFYSLLLAPLIYGVILSGIALILKYVYFKVENFFEFRKKATLQSDLKDLEEINQYRELVKSHLINLLNEYGKVISEIRQINSGFEDLENELASASNSSNFTKTFSKIKIAISNSQQIYEEYSRLFFREKNDPEITNKYKKFLYKSNMLKKFFVRI